MRKHNRVVVSGARDKAPTDGYSVRATLEAIALDPRATGTARASAARTLAELDGLLGKHQQPPERHDSAQLSQLTRAELEAELARLRASCAAIDAQTKA
jgi:hypothetical protein